MPYLQLDLPRSYPLSVKQDLAKRMGTSTPKSCKPHRIWWPLPSVNWEKATCGAAATQKRNLCREPFWRARFAADVPRNSANASPRLSSICA